MYTEQDVANVANLAIKMIEDVRSHLETTKIAYVKQIEDFATSKRKEQQKETAEEEVTE